MNDLLTEEARPEVLETDLMHRLGLPQHVLKEKRAEFLEGRDWAKKGGAICWTAAAAALLVDSFAPQDSPPGLNDQQPAPEKMPRRQVLTVAFKPLPNRTLVAAVESGVDARDRTRWILIKVRDNRRFLAGMQLLAEEVPGMRLWRFLGPPDAAPGH